MIDIDEFDGPNVNVALAMCWFSRINYYIIKFIFLLVSCHLAPH